MNNDNNGAIVFLLTAILCVLLFGSGAVLSGLGWGAGIIAVLAVGFFIIAGIARFFGTMRDEIATARAKREPWLWLFVVWPAIPTLLVILGLGALRWMDNNIRFVAAVITIPYWWAPGAMLIVGLVIAALESAHEWGPKVPGAIAALLLELPKGIIELVRKWLFLVVAPVAGPIGRWQTIRSLRAQGETIGAVSAGLSILGTLLVSLLFWCALVLVPFAIGAAEIVSRFQ